MDDQRDYAEEAANRAIPEQEEKPYWMPLTAGELTQKLWKLASRFNGYPHGEMFDSVTYMYEADIEFSNAHDAVKFAHFVDMFYETISDFRDEVNTMHQAVVITVTKRF